MPPGSGMLAPLLFCALARSWAANAPRLMSTRTHPQWVKTKATSSYFLSIEIHSNPLTDVFAFTVSAIEATAIDRFSESSLERN